MPLWERYQRCLITTDPAEFALIIGQFERVMPMRVEPPAWMKAWGEGVTSQPLRTAVDPQALAAACTLHAADVLAKDQPTESRTLYERVLARYTRGAWGYYVAQAKKALRQMAGSPQHRSQPSMPLPADPKEAA